MVLGNGLAVHCCVWLFLLSSPLSSVLYNLSALSEFKHWVDWKLGRRTPLCLEGGHWERLLSNSLYFSFSPVPVGSTTSVFILLPLQHGHRKCSLCPVQASLWPQTSPECPSATAAPQLQDITIENGAVVRGEKKWGLRLGATQAK